MADNVSKNTKKNRRTIAGSSFFMSGTMGSLCLIICGLLLLPLGGSTLEPMLQFEDTAFTSGLNTPDNLNISKDARSIGDGMQAAFIVQQAVIDYPDRLLTLSGHILTTILAQPDLARFDAPSAVWQYRSENCIADFYFNAPNRDAVSKSQITHMEFRERGIITHSNPNNIQNVSKKNCLRSLFSERFEQIQAMHQPIRVSNR